VIKVFLACAVAVLGLTAAAGAQTSGASPDTERFYGRAEYLYWWTKDSPQPTPLVSNGFLSDPDTQVLMGGKDVDFGHHSGARFTLGYWLSPSWALEASGFYLPKSTERRSIASSGAPGSLDLVVPFFDITRNSEAFSDVSSAGSFSGVASQEMTQRLWGAEGNAVMRLGNPGPLSLELLGGFRYLNLSEKFSFLTSSPDLPPGPTTVFLTEDVFDASNDFYGGQLGVRGRYQAGRFMADASVKVALGVMRQHVDVSGGLTTNFFNPPTVQAFAGGLFAQPSNIGSHRRDQFAVVPEAGLNVGFKVTDWMSIIAGYTFLYASHVVRPGNQVDRVINPSQSPAISLTTPSPLVGAPRPEFKFKTTDFWAHGLNMGLAFSF
jgi:hypothetical protein